MKIKLAISIFITLCMVLSACQPTPEESVVVQKDMNDMLEEAQSIDNEEEARPYNLNVPETYTYTNTFADGKLTINAEAFVNVPDVAKLPVASVIQGFFTQEVVSGTLEYLYDEEPYYIKQIEETWVQTKEDIEKEIVATKAAIADGVYDDDEDLLELAKERIKDLRQKYATAPETKDPPERSDGLMWMISDNNEAYSFIHVTGLDDETGEETSFFRCKSSDDVNSKRTNSMEYKRSYYLQFTMNGALRVNDDSDVSDELVDELEITLSEAKDTAQNYLDTIGVMGMECTTAYIVDDHNDGYSDGVYSKAENYAYKLYYTRVVNNVPVLVLGDVGGMGEFNVRWPFEQLDITVMNGEIAVVKWRSPCAVSEIIIENAKIIDYETAISRFEEMVQISYEGTANQDYIESLDIRIEEVQLGLFRIRLQDGDGKEGLYAPAWAFYGTVKITDINGIGYNDGCDFPQGPFIVLAVNAIDGSIIDIGSEN